MADKGGQPEGKEATNSGGTLRVTASTKSTLNLKAVDMPVTGDASRSTTAKPHGDKTEGAAGNSLKQEQPAITPSQSTNQPLAVEEKPKNEDEPETSGANSKISQGQNPTEQPSTTVHTNNVSSTPRSSAAESALATTNKANLDKPLAQAPAPQKDAAELSAKNPSVLPSASKATQPPVSPKKSENSAQQKPKQQSQSLRQRAQGIRSQVGEIVSRYNPGNLLKDQTRKQILKLVLANPEILAALFIIVLLVVAGIIAISYLASPTGSSAQSNTNVVTDRNDVLSLLASAGSASAKQELMRTRGQELLNALETQASSETDPDNKKIIQGMHDSLAAVIKRIQGNPSFDYSKVPEQEFADSRTITPEQQEVTNLEYYYARYKPLAPKLSTFATAKTLIDWVNAHPKEANQGLNGFGSSGCWRTVDYALRNAFPGSNSRGAPGGGDATPFVPTTTKQGDLTTADLQTAYDTLAKGQLPVWHIQGHGRGEHWIVVVNVVVGANVESSTVTEFDPAYGKIVTLNSSTKDTNTQPGWLSGTYPGYYLGFSTLTKEPYHGYAFTPASKK